MAKSIRGRSSAKPQRAAAKETKKVAVRSAAKAAPKARAATKSAAKPKAAAKKAPKKAEPKVAAKAEPKVVAKAEPKAKTAAAKKLPATKAAPKKRAPKKIVPAVETSGALKPPEEPEHEPDPLPEAPPAPEPVREPAPEPEPQTHRFTGAPLLPRERTAGPVKRAPRPRPEPTAAAPAPSAPSQSAWPAAPPVEKSAPTNGAHADYAQFWHEPKPVVVETRGQPKSDGEAAPVSAEGPRPFVMPDAPDGQGGDGRRRRRRRRRRRGGILRDANGQPILGADGHPMRRDGTSVTQPPAQAAPTDPLLRRLRRQFRLHDFRPGQEQVIRDLLAGRDVLAIMPTGAGKSLTYQLTAFELPGVAVVVSPLLALMSDQLQKLRRTGAVAARLDSTETRAEKRATLERIEEGRHKIIYVTPERAASGALVKELGGQKVSLFVVDEAHCVSEWGHDFRPAYLGLKQCIVQLSEAQGQRPPVLALTATATPQVADDILQQLELKDADRVHTGFARPSLQFDVRAVADLKQQVRRLLRLIRRIKGPGIVYCSTVRDVEALHGALPRLGLRVGMYHGQMAQKEREESQRAFMRNNPRIMIATNAFGLGVDKPDIRFVIHYNLPGSIEQYYQEAGRAGRDGKPSRCILLYNPSDEEVQEFFVGGKYPSKAEFQKVAFGLSTAEGTLRDIAMNSEVSQTKTRVVLGVLKDHGFAEEYPGAVFKLVGEPDKLTLGRAAEEYRKRREADRGKLESMIRYARSTRCRVKILLEYFGEPDVKLCGRCDNCQKYGAEADRERTTDLMSPIELAEEEEDREPLPELPAIPAPPRKDPTRMF